MSDTLRNYPSESWGDHVLRQDLIRLIRRREITRPRAMQVNVGPSQVGTPCDASLGYTLALASEAGATLPTAPPCDPVPAIVGTAVHAWLEEAAQYDNLVEEITRTKRDARPRPRWLTELSLAIGNGVIEMPGHCDLYDTWTNTVIDWKVLGSSSMKRIKSAADLPPGYRVQIMLYALGVEALGYQPESVALALVPRNGPLSHVRLMMEPYDRAVALAALDRVQRLATHSGAWEGLPRTPDESACRYCPVPVHACPDGMVHR